MEEKNDEVSWNLSQLLIMEIGELLKEGSKCYVKREYPKAFDYLKAVRMRIVPYLDAEELKQLEKMEDDFYFYSRNMKVSGFAKPTKEQEKNHFLLWKGLDQYNNLLFQYLKKYGLLIPMKEDRTKLNA